MVKRVGWGDCSPIYARWSEQGLSPVVVGGQAVNLWAEYFAGKAKYFRPVTSKDLDVLGDESFARTCAKALQNASVIPIDRRGHAVPMSAVVKVCLPPDDLHIDFQELAAPHTLEEVETAAVPIPTSIGKVRVMHPRHCLMTRTYNVTSVWLKDKKKYDNPIGLRQLMTAMIVFRLFMRELLVSAPGGVELVRSNYEKLFTFLTQYEGKRLWELKKIDLFSCIEPLDGLPEGFLEYRYTKMHAAVAERHPAPRL